MQDALYGADGFYRSPGGPAAHFRTSAHASPLWGAAVHELARRADRALDEPPDFTVVDMGAGGGELLTLLADVASARWHLVGVDVADRPSGLPRRVDWHHELPHDVAGVVIAVEWLDVVPLDVVELTDDGPRLVEVDDTGDERLGAPPDAADLAWLSRWWPLAEAGDRAEIGRPRDDAWADAVSCVARGVAVAVDYAADPRRDLAGTLTGYRDGRQVAPVPDGSCDITAHVLMESCAAAVGAECELVRQRDALTALGVVGRRPAYAGDPVGYLRELGAVGEAAELRDPGGLGGFTWLLQRTSMPSLLDPAAEA